VRSRVGVRQLKSIDRGTRSEALAVIGRPLSLRNDGEIFNCCQLRAELIAGGVAGFGGTAGKLGTGRSSASALSEPGNGHLL
jgi:hypothetical protein